MKKIVVKIGSSVIAPTGKLEQKLVEGFVSDILSAQMQSCKVILVTSGAIAAGADALGLKKKPASPHSLMAIASLGQIILMDAYKSAFSKHGAKCAQILLTWDDFDIRRRFLNARSTIETLLSMGITPVINENDAVSSEEIKFGDNDRLCALVGDLIGSDKVIILSDVAGLLDETGQIKKTVEKIDSKIYKLVKTKSGKFTSGGMYTKLQAAQIATASGATLFIASGKEKDVISRIVRGEAPGTRFLPAVKIEKARKRWIAFSKKIKGKICIDDGARDAVINRGKSLLCVGILNIEGDFKRKDSVCLVDKSGNILGCGLAEYSCDELKDSKNKKLQKEVIHRDNFVIKK
ncbi:MAG: glutamate 5-kinase [Candidatus Omnitrophica bacterium]|nr:glutamate 5-kinase [Candidatus Omnitrophota bacterium]